MSGCEWPSGSCACWEEQQNKADPFGRVWMHCEEGLSLTKASLSSFMMFVLKNNIEIGSINAFNPRYDRSLVTASVLLHPSQFEKFEQETGARLRTPPRIVLA